jgi:hypothetical protein
MAPFMVTLKRQKSGVYLARKVIPQDVRKEYAALYGMNWEEKLSLPSNTPASDPNRSYSRCESGHRPAAYPSRCTRACRRMVSLVHPST